MVYNFLLEYKIKILLILILLKLLQRMLLSEDQSPLNGVKYTVTYSTV